MQIKFHHVGIVVRSIDEQLSYYQGHFGLTLVRPKTFDPLQDVHVAFLQSGESTVLLELIEPASENSPVVNALNRGGGLNHLCYSVSSLDTAIDHFIGQGSLLVQPPTPAVAFGGRRIAFLYTALRELVELVEEKA